MGNFPMMLPQFEAIDLENQPMTAGYYTLGMIEKYRQDIELINLEQWESITDYSWLDFRIDQALNKNKIVCIAPWDEDIIGETNHSLSTTVNKYKNDSVYWITQLSEENFKIYTHQQNIQIKIIEIQWYLLNDCLTYYNVKKENSLSKNYNKNYLCMLGRYESHKYNLGKELYHQGLGEYGLITVAYPKKYPDDHRQFAHSCPVDLYPNVKQFRGSTRANSKIENIWISGNVENYINLEKEFSSIPLMINPDSTCGIMQMSEKLLWPILLGKLFLLYGNSGIMASIQRFYDIDISKWANLSFDNVQGWSPECKRNRLLNMIEHNRELIKDCRDLYFQFKNEIEHSKVSVGKNLYRHFVKQLEKIQ